MQLFSWTPSDLIRYKDGGIFRDSKNSPGRKPIYRQNSNAIETMVISIHGNNKNHVAQLVRYLKTAADEAFDYWLPGSSITRPAYLKTAAGSETVYRYAPIYKIEIAGLTDLHFGEYEGGLIVNGGAWTSGFAQVTLTIERGEWSDKIPEEYTNIVNAVNVTNGLFTPTNDISHIYRYDASSDTFSSNLIGASLPYDLFTNPSGTGDRLYIGSASQFTNLVFNLQTAGVGAELSTLFSSSGGLFSEMVYNGMSDGTAGFTLTGIKVITFNPAAFDWQLVTVNGVSRYWIVFVASFGTSWTTVPRQKTSDPTTVYGSSSATIGAIGGDLEALARATITGNSVGVSGRILLGLKEILDGDLFQGYINITTTQDNPDITATIVNEAFTTFGAIGDAPVGSGAIFSPDGAQAISELVNITLGTDTTPYFKGKYRFFLRTQVVDTNDVFNGMVNVSISGSVIYSKSFNLTNNSFGHIYVDLGILNIYDNNPNISSDSITFEIWAGADQTGTLYFYDLVLIPANLSIVDATAETLALGLSTGRYILIDSITSPKDDVLAGVFNSSNDRRMATVSAICNGKFTIPANKSLSLWLTALDTDAGSGSFDMGFLGIISIDVAKQYAFVRHNT